MRNFRKLALIVLSGLVGFAILTLFGALIIRYTPLAESYGYAIIIGSCSIVCFFAGIFVCSSCDRRGLLNGISVSAVIILLIFLICSILFSDSIKFVSILSVWYLIPIIFGGLGGVLGVNMKK